MIKFYTWETKPSMEQEKKPITTAIEEFLWHCRFAKKLDDKTIKAYTVDLRQFAQEIDSEMDIFDISKYTIRCYLQQISHLKHKTIKRKIASIRSMFNYFEYEYEDYINPMRKMQIKMKEPLRLPVVMTIDEVRNILKYLYCTASSLTNLPMTYSDIAKMRNIAVVEMLFATGVRISELCSLRNRDVDLNVGIVRIIGKGNKERIVQLCQSETLSALRHWAEYKPDSSAADAPFFTNRLHNALSTQSVRHMIHHISSAVGIDKHITPHTFRHTFATLLLEEDVDMRYIQKLLGHSSITTTQIYTHVNQNKQREILQNKHPRRLI